MTKQDNSKKLGMGLSALLGGNNNKPSITSINNEKTLSSMAYPQDSAVQLISVNKIVAGIYQPRKHFNHEALVELADSIDKNGVIQPIIVRKADEGSDIYEIIAGERRFRASKIAELKEIPAIIKDIDNNQALEFAIVENVQREDLSAIEEAKGYKQLMNEFYYTQEKVAEKVSCSRSRVANALRLLTLPEEVQEMIDGGLISSGHGRMLVGKHNAIEIAGKIIKNSLSVRETEDLFKNTQFKEVNEIMLSEAMANSADLKKKDLKNQYLKAVESNLSTIMGDKLKIKASYDPNTQKGKITISYSDLKDIEELIKKLSNNS